MGVRSGAQLGFGPQELNRGWWLLFQVEELKEGGIEGLAKLEKILMKLSG